MSVESWMAHAETSISSRTRVAERMWAWAHLAHAAALSEIRNAAAGHTTDAVWVEPAMAWTLDHLTDAGIRTSATDLPPIPLGTEREILLAVLDALASCAADDDPSVSPPVRDACAMAARRASVAVTRLGTGPP